MRVRSHIFISKAFSVLGIAALLAACSSSNGGLPAGVDLTPSTPEIVCPKLPPLDSVPKNFPAITLPPGAVVIEPAATPKDGRRIDLAIPGGHIDETQDFFRKSLPADGYTIVGADYEGFEAEVYFGKEGSRLTGMAHIVQSCDDILVASVQLFHLNR